MNEMTIQEVQDVSLEILRDVHRFCESNGICYTLQGGTLLGAVRQRIHPVGRRCRHCYAVTRLQPFFTHVYLGKRV